MIAIDINSSKYATAKRRGYLYGYINEEEGWESSFVGVWVKKYPQLIKVLDIVCQVIGNSAPEWQDFTDANVKAIKEALVTSVSANSARTYFASLKAVLSDMRHEVTIPCSRFSEILKTKKSASQAVYLTDAEVKALEAVGTKSEREQYVKCLFLISCYTGCRHSDAMMLDESNIIGNVLSYVSRKTSIEAIIPVHTNLRQVLNSYDRHIMMYDDEYNKIIRSLCQRAGINTICKVVKAGNVEVGAKWQFVASHTARRTFASLLYLRGVDVATIGRLMGHSGDLKMTMRYIVAEKSLDDTAMSFFVS